MDYDLIIARYGEIGIKSDRVRKRFENKLISNIKAAFKADVKVIQGRVFIYPKDFNEAIGKLERIFGIVSFSLAISTKTDKEAITNSLKDYTHFLIDEGLIDSNKSFAIRCRRVGNHDFTSQELAAYGGSVVIDEIPCPVNLSDPDFEIFIEVRDNDTYIFHEMIKGPGGLPVGTQGKVVSLLSGGIDSPVASYMMLKRGCKVTAIHFDSGSFISKKSIEKVNKIVEVLKTYSYGSKLDLIVFNFEDYLKNCKENASDKMTCVLCKSAMYALSEDFALSNNALAIVDGSSLGQVASQTLDNILASRDGVSIPVLSPLIGFDKVEITDIAKDIGTYDISIIDDGGCSAVPKYPETKADLNRIREEKDKINFEGSVNKIFNENF